MSTNSTIQPAIAAQKPCLPKVVIATTAMLSFISFWRAAAIVLNDLGSSAFYAGAIAEQAIGKAAPWFILAIMLFAYAVRSMYIGSCSMFVRGGVYRVVKEAMGSTLAKFSVSALMFDYILTGPISGVSAASTGAKWAPAGASTALSPRSMRSCFCPPGRWRRRKLREPCPWLVLT